MIGRVFKALLPPLFLILVVLGSIFMGIATPTEAGALGAVGAMFLAWMNGRLSKNNLEDALDDTVQLTTMVVFLLIGSTAFTLVFRGLYGDIWIEDFLVNLPGGKWGLIVISQLVIFVLGFLLTFSR